MKGLDNIKKTSISVDNDCLFTLLISELNCGRSSIIKAKGDSMYPTIRGEKDSILISPIEREIGIYDIVLADCKPKGYVVHRVVKKKDGLFILQGDSNLLGIETCSIQNIKGVVTHRIRNGKYYSLSSNWILIKFHTYRLIKRLLVALYRYFKR